MKRWWWLGVAVLCLLWVTGAAAQENVLVLYGSPDRDWVAAVAAKFEKDTGIKVQWIRAAATRCTPDRREGEPKGRCLVWWNR
jgi:ABC-type thiamine transport system substrate-binding protein